MSSATKLTYEDYLAIPDDGRRHELIDGEHYVVPAPDTSHQFISGRLYRLLVDFAERSGAGAVLYAPVDVILSPEDIVQPDIFFVRREHLSRVERRGVVGAPDLVVEILSGNRRYDEHVKRALYERYGVPEYWIVDPDARAVLVLRHTGERYTETRFAASDVLTSPLFPGLDIALGAIFA